MPIMKTPAALFGTLSTNYFLAFWTAVDIRFFQLWSAYFSEIFFFSGIFHQVLMKFAADLFNVMELVS